MGYIPLLLSMTLLPFLTASQCGRFSCSQVMTYLSPIAFLYTDLPSVCAILSLAFSSLSCSFIFSAAQFVTELT